MKNTFSLTIALPGMSMLTYEAKSLSIPSNRGYLGVMAGRQPLLAAIEAGIISIVDVEDRQHYLGVTGGFCEMIDNKATLLCDSLVLPSDVDLEVDEPDKTVFNRDTSEMTEKQKRDYVYELLQQKLRKFDQPLSSTGKARRKHEQ